MKKSSYYMLDILKIIDPAKKKDFEKNVLYFANNSLEMKSLAEDIGSRVTEDNLKPTPNKGDNNAGKIEH